MGKKVRYAVGAAGAVGVIPMLGLAAPAHAAAPAAQTGKTVRTAFAHAAAVSAASTSLSSAATTTCLGHVGNHNTHSGVTIRFYSAPVGSKTCIGTIQASAPLALVIGASVANHYGSFCIHSKHASKINFACRHVFRRRSLEVNGGSGDLVGHHSVHSTYPFNHNGF